MALCMKSAAGVTARAAAKPASAKSMMVWQPNNNKFFETFSYLPPLTNDQIAKQVDYIVNNNWTPCLEFSNEGYITNDSVVRLTGVSANYYDNRYWTMWKLPMFGCTDASQVLREIEAAVKAFPDAYIRMAAFDAVRQVQVASMLVHRPSSQNDYRKPNERQV